MLFLEDLYASKRSTAADKRVTRRQTRSLRPKPPLGPETHNARDISSSFSDQDERGSSNKRNSLFSRRKSTATSSSGESVRVSSGVLSQGGASRRSSIAEMAVVENESLKSKLLSSFHSGRKNGTKKSSDTGSTRAEFDFFLPGRKEKSRNGHKRATSIEDAEYISNISAPYGFQHLSKIERATGSKTDGGVLTERRPRTSASHITPPPEELQSSLAKRTSKRPPPLRPKRPDEGPEPYELLSPQYNVPTLRQIRSAETFGQASQRAYSRLSPGFPSPAPVTSPIPPRRSSRRQGFTPEDTEFPPLHSSKSADLSMHGNWNGILSFYDHQDTEFQREVPPLPQSGQFPPVPAKPAVSIPVASPLFSPPLEKVVEEPETPASPRPGNEPQKHFSIRHAKSSPAISRNASTRDQAEVLLPRLSNTSSITSQRPLSDGSDTVGDLSKRPFVIKEEDIDNENGKSVVLAADGSSYRWEDDIEFCYEHSAEAQSNFDWNNMSKFVDSDSEVEEAPVPKSSPKDAKKHQFSSSFDSTSGSEDGGLVETLLSRKSTTPSQESVPDLVDHGLSHSGSTNSLALSTPRDKLAFQLVDRPGLATYRRSNDSIPTSSPQIPPLGLPHDLDSDRLYEELMAGFNRKHNISLLPHLEAKSYTMPSPPLSQKSPITEKPQPLPPTSMPSKMAASMSKKLPPLPSESLADGALPSQPVMPSALSVNSIVAQLRSPTDSPIERQSPGFTPPVPAWSAPKPPTPPPPPPKSLLRKTAALLSPSPTTRIRESGSNMLSRNDSNDTVVTAIIAPPSPPASPEEAPAPPKKEAGKTLGDTAAAHGHSTSGGGTDYGSSFISPPSPSPPSPSVSAAPSVQQVHRKAASSDGLLLAGSPLASPTSRSPTSNPREVQHYSLFPSAPRPAPPRRMTAT